MYIPFHDFRAGCEKRIKMMERQGYAVDGFIEQLGTIPDSYDALIAFAKSLNDEIPIRSDFPYQEPNGLEQIQALRSTEREDTVTTYQKEKEIKDRIYGGVAGRMLGCALGKPLEIHWDLPKIKEYLEGADAWPLTDFVPPYSITQSRPLRRDCVDSMKGFIKYMQQDDDINYFILSLKVLEGFGFNFTTQDLAYIWMENIPYHWTWGPQHTLYLHLTNHWLSRRNPLPVGKEWDAFVSFLNSGEESIGGMIRADAYGLVNPAQTALAAEMAWRDGRLTHGKTGLYAGMWTAATIAAAFCDRDPVKAIQAGMDQIPKTSRYYECLKEFLEWSLEESDWYKVWERFNQKWGHLGHVNTVNETAAIINALIHSVDAKGDVDFEKAICITVMQGWDTDCSGATAGCIAGVLCGYSNIPDKWLSKLNDTFYSCVATEGETKITGFAERMYQMSRIVRECAKVAAEPRTKGFETNGNGEYR